MTVQIYDMTHADEVIRECAGGVPTLQARMGTGGNQVPIILYSHPQNDEWRIHPEQDTVQTITAAMGEGGGHVPMILESVCMGHDERSAQFVPETTDPIVQSDYKAPPLVAYIIEKEKTDGADNL